MAEEGSKQVHGPAIRAIREALNLAQNDVAAEAGISAPYLSQIEKGIRESVSEDTFRGLVKALRVRDKRALIATTCVKCSDTKAVA